MKLEKVAYRLTEYSSRFEIVNKIWLWKDKLIIGITILTDPIFTITNKYFKITIEDKTFIFKNNKLNSGIV